MLSKRGIDLTCGTLFIIVLLSYVFYNWTGKGTYIGYIPAVSNLIQRKAFNRSESNGAAFKKEKLNVLMDVETETSKPGRKCVIVLAYMHTGSTFLGSILQNHKHTFYQYENLRSLMYSTRAGNVIHFLNGTDRQLLPFANVQNLHHNIHPVVGADAIRKMITCNHHELDLATLANQYTPANATFNRDLHSFFGCQEKLFGRSIRLKAVSALKYVKNAMLRNTSRAVEIVSSCLPLLTETCQQSNMVVEKFIRMTMEMAKLLLENFSNLKIIHLFRDPRAMLDSQVRKRDSGAQVLSIFNGRAEYLCRQMTEDHRLAKELERHFPGQIYTLRYEDMVDSPMETMKTVFNFIDVPFTKEDEHFVKSRSRPSSPVNGTIPLSLWRKHVRAVYLKTVDTHCSSLYKEFGYLKLSFSAIKDPEQNDHRR